ncbi:10383_t:CDS:1, partial [Gigaspora margarita]
EQLQASERSYHKTTPTLVKKLPENKFKPGEEGYPKTTPTPAKKLIELEWVFSRKLSRTTPNPVKKIIREQLQNF